MGSKRLIQRIVAGQLVNDGMAEVVNVIRYEGEGIYLAECIFEADPERCVREVRFDIDIEKHLEELREDHKAPPPSEEPVRSGLFAWFRTQNAAKRKGGAHVG